MYINQYSWADWLPGISWWCQWTLARRSSSHERTGSHTRSSWLPTCGWYFLIFPSISDSIRRRIWTVWAVSVQTLSSGFRSGSSVRTDGTYSTLVVKGHGASSGARTWTETSSSLNRSVDHFIAIFPNLIHGLISALYGLSCQFSKYFGPLCLLAFKTTGPNAQGPNHPWILCSQNLILKTLPCQT